MLFANRQLDLKFKRSLMRKELIINKEKIMSSDKDDVKRMLNNDRSFQEELVVKQFKEAFGEIIEGLTLRVTSLGNDPFEVKIKKTLRPTEKRPKIVKVKKVQGKITPHGEIFTTARKIVEKHFLAMTEELHQMIELLASEGKLQIPYSLSVSIRNNELWISVHDSQCRIHERSPIPDPQPIVILRKRKLKGE